MRTDHECLHRICLPTCEALVFECDRVTPETLVGTKGAPGELLDSVRLQPFQMIIFDGIDRSAAELVQALSTMLTQGGYRSSNTEKAVSFQNAVVIMTTTKATAVLGAIAAKSLSEAAWHRQAVDVVATETLIDRALLNAVSDVLVCYSPTDLVKAEVVALLMRRECSAHGVTLSQVYEDIVASQVVKIDDATGFGLTPECIKKVLRKPLVAATQNNHKRLSLKVRRLPDQLSGIDS